MHPILLLLVRMTSTSSSKTWFGKARFNSEIALGRLFSFSFFFYLLSHSFVGQLSLAISQCIMFASSSECLSNNFGLSQTHTETIAFVFRRTVRGSSAAQHSHENIFITIIRPLLVELVHTLTLTLKNKWCCRLCFVFQIGTFLLVLLCLWNSCSSSATLLQGALCTGCTLMCLLACFGEWSGGCCCRWWEMLLILLQVISGTREWGEERWSGCTV